MTKMFFFSLTMPAITYSEVCEPSDLINYENWIYYEYWICWSTKALLHV